MIPIYFINLESRPDRRDFMERQFSDLGLSAERVAAVTPDDLSADELASSCDPDSSTFLRPVELACSLSHERAWRMLLSGPSEHALILEDDAKLSRAMPAFIDALGTPPEGLIRVETTGRRLRVLPSTRQVTADVTLRPFRSTESGACAYIISRAAAHTMIASSLHHRLQVDYALYCPLRSPIASHHRVLTDPALSIQLGNLGAPHEGVSASDIDSGRPIMHRYRSAHPWRYRLDDIGLRVRRTVDHFAYLPRGLRRKSIAFLQ